MSCEPAHAWRSAASLRVSSRTGWPPRFARVGTTVRFRIWPDGHSTKPAAIFVPPMSRAIAPTGLLLLIGGPRVIVKMVTFLALLKPKIERRKTGLHRDCPLPLRRLGRSLEDLEQVNILLDTMQRRSVL